jgi:hypothetical protein
MKFDNQQIRLVMLPVAVSFHDPHFHRSAGFFSQSMPPHGGRWGRL